MVIDLDDLDPNFKYEVAAEPGAENIGACFTCGQCTAGCPVSEVDGRYNPRKIVRMIAWGMKEELLKSDLIWMCNSCYTCFSHCPQNVKFTNVIDVLRNIAVKEGYAPEQLSDTLDELDQTLQKIRASIVASILAEDDDKAPDVHQLTDAQKAALEALKPEFTEREEDS